MFGKNRKKKVGLCVMVVTASLVLAALWAVLATPETALAVKPEKPHRRKPTTAQVTITGPMQTEGVSQTFGLGMDNEQTLSVSRGVWTDWGAVPISYNFAKTVDKNAEGYWCVGDEVLLAHLDDSVSGLEEFPYRWGVSIVIDMSSLGEFEAPGQSSTTNYKGGHSIDITTEPDDRDFPTPTITGTNERLWIPEGPSKSGPVTVEWVSDNVVGDKRVRVFRFTPPFKIQVVSNPKGSEKKDKPRKWMRCDNLDGPIEVTVETTL